MEDGVAVGAEKDPEENECGEDQQAAELAAALASVALGVIWWFSQAHKGTAPSLAG